MTDLNTDDVERRTFLKMAGATGAAAAIGGVPRTAKAGSCGDTVESNTNTGYLDYGEGDTYTFTTALSDPCQVTYSLTGPSDADFDLYLTLDGRTPTTVDYDRKSESLGSSEEIVLDNDEIPASAEFGVLVDAYQGAGDYELHAEELGTGDGSDTGNSSPTAQFSVDDATVDPGVAIDFEAYDSSDSDGNLVAYDWDFDDGESATGRTAEHAYDEPGEYEVILTVTDDDGATDSASLVVEVQNEYPNPSFTIEDSTVKPGVAVNVDASDSSDPDGTVEKYKWWFDDGTTATGKTASHAYDSPGTYEIRLRVWDNYEWYDTTSKTVTVEGGCGRATDGESRSGSLKGSRSDSYTYSTKTNDPCELVLALNGSEGSNMDLYVTTDGRTPTRSDYDHKAATSSKDEVVSLGDNAVDANTELGVLVYATSGGDYDLNVNEWGTVDNEPPTAKISASNTSIKEGEKVTFDGSGSTDPDGDHTIQSYEWTLPGGWGGPKTKTGKVISEEFGSSGSHDVTLKVTDKWGRTDTATVTVDVESTGGSFW